jgi:hypothetical protein
MGAESGCVGLPRSRVCRRCGSGAWPGCEDRKLGGAVGAEGEAADAEVGVVMKWWFLRHFPISL